MSVQNDTVSERQAAVYRLYAADGSLLYIGSSYNPKRRCLDHHTKPWWAQVDRRADEWHPSKAEAYVAEMAAIAAESPTHNEMGTPRYVPPAVKAAARRSSRTGELSIAQILSKHGVSRQSLHTYRQRPDFPKPLREGTSRLRWLESEVAAFFAANPKQPGKRTDLPAKQQGEPAMSGQPITRLSREDQEASEQLHATANLIEARWPGEHPTLVRDLRDLVDAIEEESGVS
ncbi:GIY-YIG nuclease family protein [Streptomyces parvulus]|uniref:GIY-YIG nuclease family protein n=1 Tax=Streptomyces parvulus TaxID=146923 RepID=UPI00368C1247